MSLYSFPNTLNPQPLQAQILPHEATLVKSTIAFPIERLEASQSIVEREKKIYQFHSEYFGVETDCRKTNNSSVGLKCMLTSMVEHQMRDSLRNPG